MNFIPYIDEFGTEHFFDCSKVMFTMAQPVPGHFDHETQMPTKFVCKVALDCLGNGFIIADEEPASIVARIKEANGVG